MKSYTSREIMKILKQDGWKLVRIHGSHHMFQHPNKPGTIPLPHPKKSIPEGTVKNIFNQAGLKLE